MTRNAAPYRRSIRWTRPRQQTPIDQLPPHPEHHREHCRDGQGRHERAESEQEARNADGEAGQHSPHRRQVRRYVLPPVRRQEIGAAFERVVRPVFDQRLEPDRARCVSEPAQRWRRPKIAGRTVGRTIASGSAPVERGRGGAGAIDVGDRRAVRPVEADSAAQVVVARSNGSGNQGHHGTQTATSGCSASLSAQQKKRYRLHPSLERTEYVGERMLVGG